MNPNQTITPATGYTPAAQAQANLNTTLASMPTIPPQQLQQDLGQATGAQSSLQSAYPTWARGQVSNLQQQAGVPQLQQGMSNLSSLFPLYLADQQAQQGQTGQNIGQVGFNQFANPQAFGNFSPSTLQDYQNANPQALINQVVAPNTFNSGFQGFNNPGAITAAGGVVPQSASNLISSLSNAIGFENSNLVSPAMATASESYQGNMNLMNNLVSLLGSQQSQNYDSSQRALDRQNALDIASLRLGGTATSQLKAAKADIGSFLDSVVGKDGKVSPSDYLIAQQKALEDYGIDPKTFDGEFAQKYVNTGHYQDYNVDPNIFGSEFAKQDASNTAELNGMKTLVGIAQNAANKFNNINPILRNVPGASHLIPDLASANADLYSALSSLRQSAVGGRITQKEVNWLLDNRMPSALDSPEVMNAKIQDIQNQLNNKINNPNYVIGQSPSSNSGGSSGGSDPLGILGG